MRLSLSKKRQSDTSKDKGASTGLAKVAIQFGRYVSLQTQQFLQDIRESDNPSQEVSKKTVDDFAKAGMPDMTDPFQENGPCRKEIDNARKTIA